MEVLLTITPYPILSVSIWLLLLLGILYLARKPFNRLMVAAGKIFYNGTRLAATSVKLAEKKLQNRNKEVLIASGRELAERRIEREFERISSAIHKNLNDYPTLQRKFIDELYKLEEDHKTSAVIPQTMADWARIIDAVAQIKPSGDHLVVKTLEQIHQTMIAQHKTAVETHRRDMARRHAILSRMLPFWRSTRKKIDTMEKGILTLGQRSKKIDRYMDVYDKICSQTNFAERQLSVSSLSQLLISAVVLVVAAFAAVINYNLVTSPMSEMVGGNSTIGNFKIAEVAGMLIVGLQVVLGFFLMDTLRITRLFSVFGGMEDGKRRVFFWFFFCFLVMLAGVESTLALMRYQMAANMETLRQSLAGVENAEVLRSKIPMFGQMLMGFILPFVLTFVAIAFESFVIALRTSAGIVGTCMLRASAFILRLMGNLGFYAALLMTRLYDLIIFPALWLEDLVIQRFQSKAVKEEKKIEECREIEDVIEHAPQSNRHSDHVLPIVSRAAE